MPEGSPVAEEGRTGLSGSDSEEESGRTGSGVAESGGAGAAESAAAADGQDEQAEPPAGARRQAVGGGSGGDDEDGERESGAGDATAEAPSADLSMSGAVEGEGKTGLSSDSDEADEGVPATDGTRGGAANDDGDTEMADATHKDVFGDSDSDDEEGGSRHKGQKVILNKETGQLERGPVEDAPEHAIQDSQVGRDKRAVPRETLNVTMPALPRPPKGARLVYVNPPKRHVILDHAPFGTVEAEAKKIASDRAMDTYYQSASFVRWRYREGAAADDAELAVAGAGANASEAWEKMPKESNARFVEWSDGSLTLHVGEEVFDVKKESLGKNKHHLYVKHDDNLLDDAGVIEGHGVMDSRLVIKPTDAKLAKKVLANVTRQFGKKTIDKDAMFVRRLDDDQDPAAAEASRIRDSARKGAAARRGMAGDLTEEFLENDIDGDVGGYLQRSKRQRRQPNAAALRRAKQQAAADSDSSSGYSSDDAPPPKRAALPSSSSSSSSSSEDEAVAPAPAKKTSTAASKKAAIESSDSD